MIPNMKSLRKISHMRKEIAAEIAAWETGERELNSQERIEMQWMLATFERSEPSQMLELLQDEPCEYTVYQRLLFWVYWE